MSIVASRLEPETQEPVRSLFQHLAYKLQLANVLTIIRIPLTLLALPSFLQLAMPGWWWGFGLVPVASDWGRFWQGGLLFTAAALCDLFDGMIARWSKSTSAFGQFGDPLADKLMNWTVFAAASIIFFPPSWKWLAFWYLPLWEMAKLDLASQRKHWRNYREARRTGIRCDGHGANMYGKIKMWAQLAAIIVCLAALCPISQGKDPFSVLSNRFVAGILAAGQPFAWAFLVLACALGHFSVRVRIQAPSRFAEAATA